MSWKKVDISSVADQIRGVSYKPDDLSDDFTETHLPVLRANNVTENGIRLDDLVYVDKKRISKNQILKSGDILIVASSGSKSIVGRAILIGTDMNASFGAFCKVMRPNDKVDKSYLGFFFRSAEYRRTISHLSAGANINNLRSDDINNLKIPLPPLHIQKQIANILDKADALRKKDQELLQKYDELAQSIFIDMFGDPVKNEKGWEVMELGKCIDKLTAGNSYGGEDKILNKDEIGVLKVSAVTSGIFRSDQYKAVNKKLVKKNIIKVKKGDLLFSRANTRELVGATCVVDQNYDHLFLPDKLWRIDLNKNKSLNYFIKFLLSQEGIRYNLNKAATGTSGSMLNISMQKLRDLEIIMPGLSFQIKFEKVIDNLLLQRKINTYSFDQTENLFQSLLQKAFTGELIHD